jgi:hypothetical protein
MEFEGCTLKRSNVCDGFLDIALLGSEGVTRNFLARRAGLLLDPRKDGLLVSATSVVGSLAIAATKLIWSKAEGPDQSYNLTYRKKWRVGKPLTS